MALSDEFLAALVRLAIGYVADLGMLPTVLARTCVEVLGVDGASVSLMSEQVRMPLGADSAMSADAESLQFTLGDGPCLEAYRSGEAGNFPAAEIARRWPVYAQRLADETPYRSCATAPLHLGDGLMGALDLYLASPDGLPDSAMGDVGVIATELTRVLLTDSANADPDRGPSWLHSDSVRARANLWVAIGLFLPSSRLTATEIVAVIRGYAFRHGQTVDDVTESLARRRLSPGAVLAD